MGAQRRRSAVVPRPDAARAHTGLGAAASYLVLVEAGSALAASAMALVLLPADVWPAAVTATAAWLVLAYSGLPALRGPVQRRLRPLGRATLVVLAMSAVITGLSGSGAEHQTAAVVAVLAAACAATGVRIAGARHAGPVRVVLVGHDAAVEDQRDRWRTRDDVHVVGVISVAQASTPATPAAPEPRRAAVCPGFLDGLPQYVERVGAEMVALLPGPGLDAAVVRRVTWALDRAPVALLVLGGVGAVAPRRLTRRLVGGEGGCELALPRHSIPMVALKHGIDRSAAAVLLVLLAPLIALLALAVRLDSTGPSFVTQTRVGQHGRLFRIHKLRSMRVGAGEHQHRLASRSEADGALFTMWCDPRTTRLGAVLRRSSLDELPQLLNVLRGEMSLIGPRPVLPSEVAEMGADALRRLVVRPGMTGLWQVSGRCLLGWEDSLALDSYYADNWGLGSDVGIAARTASAVLTGKGAW